MAPDNQPDGGAAQGGDRRGKDRRAGDRRQLDRRTPPPVWRRPWALVAYGVVGTLVVLLLVNRSRPPQEVAVQDEVVSMAPQQPTASAPAEPPTLAAAEDALRPADFERLMAEGDAAKGRPIRAELFCSSINQIALRSVDRIESSVAALADGSQRVPAAECKWGAMRGDEPRPDFMLLVPPDLAEEFASAPMVEDGFVRRRRVLGVVEWVGRSEALALRTGGVLRQFPAAGT